MTVVKHWPVIWFVAIDGRWNYHGGGQDSESQDGDGGSGRQLERRTRTERIYAQRKQDVAISNGSLYVVGIARAQVQFFDARDLDSGAKSKGLSVFEPERLHGLA